MNDDSIILNFRVDGREIIISETTFSSRNMRSHFMKHVARINECVLEEVQDPESWEKIWPEPGMFPEKLSRRRRHFVKRLQAAGPPCSLAESAPAAKNLCRECSERKDARALQDAVDKEFKREFSCYLRVAADSLRRSVAKDAWKEPRVFICRSKDKHSFKVHALSPERVFSIGSARPGRPVLHFVTVYRPSAGKRLKSIRDCVADFLEKRRAAKAGGLLADCEVTAQGPRSTTA